MAWYKPLVLVFGYAVYAFVCAKYQALTAKFCPVAVRQPCLQTGMISLTHKRYVTGTFFCGAAVGRSG